MNPCNNVTLQVLDGVLPPSARVRDVLLEFVPQVLAGVRAVLGGVVDGPVSAEDENAPVGGL